MTLILENPFWGYFSPKSNLINILMERKEKVKNKRTREDGKRHYWQFHLEKSLERAWELETRVSKPSRRNSVSGLKQYLPSWRLEWILSPFNCIRRCLLCDEQRFSLLVGEASSVVKCGRKGDSLELGEFSSSLYCVFSRVGVFVVESSTLFP